MFKKIALWLLIALTPILGRAEFQDPTKPEQPPAEVIGSETAIEDTLVLSAIWITATAQWATINGIIVKKGQTILNNVKILKITQHAVFVNHNGSIKTLQLLKSSHKTQ